LWADPLALNEDAVEKQPRAALTHVFLARQLDHQAWRARLEDPPDDRKSRTLSRLAAGHYVQALALPDVYLYNPVVARVLLGGSLLEAGDTPRAVAVLSEVLPAPDPARLAAGDRREERYQVVDGPFNFPYALTFPDASRAHQWLATASLDSFLHDTLTLKDARERLERAARHNAWARHHDPHAMLPCFSAAYLFLLQEVFASAPPQDAHASAKTILRVAKPYIDAMSRVPEVLAEFRPPTPEDRPKALACLGMAKASFDAASRKGVSPEQIQAYRDKTLIWARRAVEFDPGFSETYWFLAEMHQVMANAARDGRDLRRAAQLQQETASWLAKINPGAPRYRYAQEILARMGGVRH